MRLTKIFFLTGPPKALDDDETEFLEKVEMVRLWSKKFIYSVLREVHHFLISTVGCTFGVTKLRYLEIVRIWTELFYKTISDLQSRFVDLVCVWLQIKEPTYFTIWLIFVTIHGSHYTFWYYLWVPLYYFS